jgi:hypothetical protein
MAAVVALTSTFVLMGTAQAAGGCKDSSRGSEVDVGCSVPGSGGSGKPASPGSSPGKSGSGTSHKPKPPAAPSSPGRDWEACWNAHIRPDAVAGNTSSFVDCTKQQHTPPTTANTSGRPAKPKPSQTQAKDAARHAAAQLVLPDQQILLDPEPATNRWNMILVKYPLWISATGPDTVSKTITQNGITITLKATRTKMSLDMGNGDQVNCTTTSRQTRPTDWKTESPTCGYTYRHTANTVSIKANITWRIDWTSNTGHTGALQNTTTTTRNPIHIGQILIQNTCTQTDC